jgi:putative transposase
MIIKSLSGLYDVFSLCKLVKVSRSGYYKWLKKPENPTKKDKENELIKSYIIEIHNKYRGTYGKKRICIYLNKVLTFKVNHKRVYRLMKELNIKSVIRKKVYCRKFKPAIIAENILKRDFKSERPLQKLSMDITYIPIKGKNRYLYMNAVKDLYNNEIIAYELSLSNNLFFVLKTIDKLNELGLGKNCILHTDQGFQYTHKYYNKKLKKYGIIQSMSRRGNCWDNVPIENFFGHFKSELIYLTRNNTFEEMIKLIDEYIFFYNNERIQIKSGMSPVEYRNHAA